MWSAGLRFFLRVLLLFLLGNGVAQLLHDGVEQGGVVLIGNHIKHPVVIPLFLREKIEDSKLLGQLLEFGLVLGLDGDDHGGSRVAGQPLGRGLAHHFHVLLGNRQQKGGDILHALQGQLRRRLGRL